MAQAQAEEGDREPQKTERSGDSRIIPECTAMSGTAWEARLFLSDMERAGGGGRGRAMCAPPPTPFSPPTPPAEPQGEGRGGGEEGGRESHLANSS